MFLFTSGAWRIHNSLLSSPKQFPSLASFIVTFHFYNIVKASGHYAYFWYSRITLGLHISTLIKKNDQRNQQTFASSVDHIIKTCWVSNFFLYSFYVTNILNHLHMFHVAVKFQILVPTHLIVVVYICTIEHGCLASIHVKIWFGLVAPSYKDLLDYDLSFIFQVVLNFTRNLRCSIHVLAISATRWYICGSWRSSVAFYFNYAPFLHIQGCNGFSGALHLYFLKIQSKFLGQTKVWSNKVPVVS